MKTTTFAALAVFTLGACVKEVPQADVYRQIAALDGATKQGVVIGYRYPAIKPEDVTVMFGFPSGCSNLKDVGVMVSWGTKHQSNEEILAEFRDVAAKHGADIVSYEVGVESLEALNRTIREPNEYSMMRCS